MRRWSRTTRRSTKAFINAELRALWARRAGRASASSTRCRSRASVFPAPRVRSMRWPSAFSSTATASISPRARARAATARLIDARILAEVYLQLKGGREQRLAFDARRRGDRGMRRSLRPIEFMRRAPRADAAAAAVTAEEAAAHAAFIARLAPNALWLKCELKLRSRRRLRSGGSPPRVLPVAQFRPIERREIDRVDQQRRVAAFARDLRQDLAAEREKQARALDPDQRLDVLGLHVHELEQARIDEVHREHHLCRRAWR